MITLHFVQLFSKNTTTLLLLNLKSNLMHLPSAHVHTLTLPNGTLYMIRQRHLPTEVGISPHCRTTSLVILPYVLT